jgi:chemotaxis protein CheC
MLPDQQLQTLTNLFRHGSDEASEALSKWLGRCSRISVEQVEQVPLADATAVLGDADSPVCACSMTLKGRVSGQLLLVFDDASGLALADLLLDSPSGASAEWGEIQKSAALETANIIGCAYLNSLSRGVPETESSPSEMLPSPPRFTRDFAPALLEFALMNQAMASDLVFLTRTEFRIENSPVNCNLLFIPDAECLTALREMLPA